MIPRTPQQIREWTDRMNITLPLAAQALRLGNPDTILREYCSGKRTPSDSTRSHMDLLEVLHEATIFLRNKNPKKALAVLDEAFQARFMDRDSAMVEATTQTLDQENHQ